MKKYLMTGIAAVTLCAAFTSCGHDEITQVTPDQIVKADYDAKFIAHFGKPASNQTWGFGTKTRAYNVEGNLWHDPAYYNLEYDAPVTVAEKNLVFNYVNNPTNVETVDQISFTEYWVAQIWNGNKDVNAEGVKAPTSTSYADQNGSTTTIVGGAQMDKLEILEAADKWTHCNNFNSANNTDWKEGGEGGRTLMWESGTLSFRYTNSQGSFLSEKYIIVPGAKIDASLKDFYYVCFDFEKGYTDEEKEQEVTYFYVTPTDNNGAVQARQKVTVKGYYTNDNIPDLTEAVQALNSNYVEYSNASVAGYLYGDKHCDGDGNYTDWIVRISPAKVKASTITYQGRIMAEDLTVNDDSDWDFNDVVFDWAIKDGKAYIKLLAAGGTLPLTIGGQLVDGEVVGGVEVHAKFEVGTGTMVNTGVASASVKEFVLEDGITYADGDANAIKLHVKKSTGWIEITAEQGEPAGKFNSPVGTKWCDEYVDIKRVYSSFAAWVANSAVAWAVNPVENLVDQNLGNNAE